MNYPSRTGVSVPRPPAPIIALIIIIFGGGEDGITLLMDNIYWLLEDVARRPPSYLEGASV